jgi:hypothetical protein
MQSHLVNLIVFSALVSLVFSLLLRESPRDRWRFFGWAFSAFLLSTILVGWLMRPFPS